MCAGLNQISADESPWQVAPAHYACGPNLPGQNLEVSPHIGWANAIPDADAVANFTILGRPLQFKGPGYHDKVRFPHRSYVHSATKTPRLIQIELG